MKEEAILFPMIRATNRGAIGPIRVMLAEHDSAGGALADCPNLLLTPHVAGVSREANERVSFMIAERVLGMPRR